MNIQINWLVMMISPLTPLDWKRRAVKYYPQNVAVIDGEKEFTYREFGRRVDQLSSALYQAGKCNLKIQFVLSKVVEVHPGAVIGSRILSCCGFPMFSSNKYN
ncbi:hypothetical protein [Neobacillus soli]|uniref:hypothetical protein n=1 Tax=Neobacillus soli TaxID=220688 RepID=UPI000823FF15|nr:hypothetical protein [Neobacillus soli]